MAHSLLQVREEMASLLPTLSPEQLAARPGGGASIGYHALHLVGSLDRLFTYARGAALGASQLDALRAESEAIAFEPEPLWAQVRSGIDGALLALRQMPATEAELLSAREVGRKKYPSTVMGLLFHAAEHAQRHAGQIATTARFVRNG